MPLSFSFSTFVALAADDRLSVHHVSEGHGNVPSARNRRNASARREAAALFAVGRRRDFPRYSRDEVSKMETVDAALADPLRIVASARSAAAGSPGIVYSEGAIVAELLGKHVGGRIRLPLCGSL